MSGPFAWNAAYRWVRGALLIGAIAAASGGCREAASFGGSPGQGGFGGGSAGATAEGEPPISQVCAANVACELPGVTLYSGSDVGVTLDLESVHAPGGYEFVPGAPSVRLGLAGQALAAPVRVLFDLGRRSPSADMAILFDDGEVLRLLLSDFVQATVMAEVDVGGLLRLVRIVPDLPPGCQEIRRPGGHFDITDLGELLGVSHVEGDLTLSGPMPENLATLSCLVSIEGDLTVSKTEGLASLEGLEQLTIVGGNLHLESNPDLQQADLPGLEGRIGGVTLTGHPKLEFFGTGDLVDVVGPLAVSDNGQAAPFLDLDLYFVQRVRGHADFIGNQGWSMDRSLGSLETIEGRLVLLRNDTIETMDDLLALRSIGSSVEVGDCPALRSAFGLSLVGDVGGSVHVHDNPKLELIDLGGLTNLPGDLSIAYNASASPALRIDLHELEAIHGMLDFAYNRNWDLEDGLASLKLVKGAVTLRQNDGLVALSQLESLASVEGDLSIDNNAALEQIDLPTLTDVAGSLAVHSHPRLRHLSLPEVRATAGTLIVAYNGDGTDALDLDLGRIANVHGSADVVHNAGAPMALDLSSLTLVKGHLNVFHNAGLLDLTSISQLASVLGVLDVSNNPALAWLSCKSLSEVAGNLRVHSNVRLELAEFPQLPQVAGDLYLAGNGGESPRLAFSFANLTDVAGAMTLDGNAQFDGASGFEALERVAGPLLVLENTALLGLPVPHLSEIGGELRIEQNLSLQTLTGLTAIDELGGALTVTQNPVLPTCQAHALRGWLVTAGWVGAWTIDDNAHDACLP